MCEDKDCDCHKKHNHHGWHHRHHRGYKSIVKRTENQVNVPSVLLDVADINVGDFLEITIRKVKKHGKHSPMEE